MTKTRTKNLLVTLAAATLAVASLAGCTGTATTPSSTQTTTKGPVPIPTIPTGTGVIADTKMESCDTTGTTVTAKGTVTMPEGVKGDVVVSVSWVNSADSSVYARGVTTVTGKTGDKKEWTTTATLPATADAVACVLGAVVPE
jgi:hypothetical protein